MMRRVVIYTNVISPHQLPLAREIVKRVGEDGFRYIYTQSNDADHGALGWAFDIPKWCVHANEAEAGKWLKEADVLLSGLRDFDLFGRRAKKGLKNFYMTERWFKPPIGILRLFHPRYFGYARRLCRMMGAGAVVGLPIGIHAARDMVRLCGLMHGDLRHLFSVSALDFEHRPWGRISNRVETYRARACLDKMRVWGYFVGNSELRVKRLELREGFGNPTAIQLTHLPLTTHNFIRILWVGRLLRLKRVDTIIRAVGEISTRSTRLNVSLDIYGTGPEESRLKKLAAMYGEAVKFHPPVPITEVRKLMREHDVYVLSSNAYEGWGAVVSEALEEGMKVIGTYEAGASATILPKERLFHSGDVSALIALLEKEGKGVLPFCSIGDWTARNAALALLGGEEK